MSEFRIDQITNQTGTGGPDVAGITTFTGSSGLVLPSGSTSGREGAQFGNENIVRDGLFFHIDAKYSYPTKQSPANGGYIRDLQAITIYQYMVVPHGIVMMVKVLSFLMILLEMINNSHKQIEL